GEYRVPNLAVGTYEVQVELAGFQTSIRQGITLTLGREAVVDFSLQVGNVAEQVTVTGEAPLIETTSATVGGVVDPQQIRQIPLNSRSFLELAPLQAGVTITETGERSATKGFGAKLSVSGTRAASHSFLLDGARINDGSDTIGSAAGTLAGVETVREFRVITNAYDAEYGRHSGAVVVAVTRGGTNELHGSVFEFLRNDNFDARNFFDRDPKNPLERSNPPQFARNQFGGALGGPILQDQLFFFTSYEALRERLGQTKFTDVPGLAMRQGFLRGQFIGVDPNVKPFLDTWPAPSLPDREDGTAQLVRSESQSTGQDTGTVRIDHQVSDSDSLFGRFNIDRADVREPQGSGVNYAQVTTTSSRYATAQLAHIFSPRWLSQTNASYVRTRILQDRELHQEYSVPQVSFGANPIIAGQIDVSGLTSWGADDRTPRGSIQNSYQLRQDLNFTSGRHTVKFGGNVERTHFNQSQFTTIGGIFTFGSLADLLRADVQNFQVATPRS
ncbi:MAG: carboxypeptidase regulatory-like domain-containing protein, partial [Terriglobia bacterium]